MKNQRRLVQNQSSLVAEQLRQLSRIYVLIQKHRCRYDNLVGSKLEYLQDTDKWKKFFERNSKTFKETEIGLKKELEELVKQHEWGNYLLNIKGVGAGIAGSIIGELCGNIYAHIEKDNKKIGGKMPKPKLLGYGPRKFEKTSDLWAYAGFTVNNGKAVRRKRGEAFSHNSYLKLICYKFAVNQVKQGDYYRKLYVKRLEYEAKRQPEWYLGKKVNNKGKEYDSYSLHCRRRAERYIIKKFLSNVNHHLVLKNAK